MMPIDQEMNFERLQDALVSESNDAIRKWYEQDDMGINIFFSKFLKTSAPKPDDGHSTSSKNEDPGDSLQTDYDELVGYTPIHYVIKEFNKNSRKFEEVMEIITSEDSKMLDETKVGGVGFNWTVEDSHGYTPLALAIKDDLIDVAKKLEALLPKGIENSRVSVLFSEGQRLTTNYLGFSVACKSIKCLGFLLEKGLDPYEWDSCGKRPLHIAAQYGVLEALFILLEIDRHDSNYRGNIKERYLVRENFELDLKDGFSNKDGQSNDENDADNDLTGRNNREGNESRANTAEGRLVDSFDSNWEEDSDVYVEHNGSDSEEEENGDEFLGLTDLLAIERQMAANGFEIRTDENGNITARFGDYVEGEGFGGREDSDLGCNLLHLACKYRQKEVVQFLITTGSHAQSIHDSRNDGMTALHIAAKNNEVEIVRLLIEEGSANVSLKNDILGMPAIHIACENGASEATEILLKYGSHINSRDENDYVPLHYAATNEKSLECVEKLIAGGADINAIGNDGETPVYTAISRWNLPTFWKLIRSGADAGVSHSDGTVVLGFLAANSTEELSKFAEFISNNYSLKESIDWNVVVGDDDQTSLHIAAKQRDIRAIVNLVKAGASPNKTDGSGLTPLLIIMKSDKSPEDDILKAVASLISGGADVNVADENGYRPIHFACKNGHNKLVNILLDAKADPNVKVQSTTCLHYAIKARDCVSMKLLLRSGASANAIDSKNLTALLLCSQLHFIDGLNCLLTTGKDINLSVTTEDGQSCLHLCAETNNSNISKTIGILIKYRASKNAKNKQGESPLHYHIKKERIEGVRALIEGGCDVNLLSSRDITPLMLASETGSISAVRTLLRGGANVNLQNSGWHTCIFYFSENESTAVRILRLFLLSGVDINQKDKDGDTVLHEAVLGNHPTIVRFLLQRKINVNATNNANETALFQAAKNGFSEIVQVLLRKSASEGGADPKIPDLKGVSPYQISRSHGHAAVTQMILRAMGVTLSTFAPLSKYAVSSPSSSGALPVDVNIGIIPGRIICAICQEDLRFGANVRKLPCGHEFHDPCILPWIGGEEMKNSKSCPVCKQPIAPENL